MPSHESADGATSKPKSNGRLVTTSEWRANQLADKLAKRGAGTSCLRDDADKAIKVAGSALCHHGAQLGMVTRAANKHREDYTDHNGKPAFRHLRDSTTVARMAKVKPAALEGTCDTTAPPIDVALVPELARQQELVNGKTQHLNSLASDKTAPPNRGALGAPRFGGEPKGPKTT